MNFQPAVRSWWCQVAPRRSPDRRLDRSEPVDIIENQLVSGRVTPSGSTGVAFLGEMALQLSSSLAIYGKTDSVTIAATPDSKGILTWPEANGLETLALAPAKGQFSLTREEVRSISQIVISSGIKFSKHVFAFTEQGVAMLSSVLNSPRAVQVNIEIMRAFVRLREATAANRELAQKLAELEQRIASHDEEIQTIFEAIRQLMTPPEPPRKEIGFHIKEDSVPYRITRKTVRR